MEDTMSCKTNLFFHATSELSQDAFFVWLCNWADSDYMSVDKALHECAKSFVKEVLLSNEINEDIKTIETLRQYKKIDIIVIVNKKYLIVIEDKTYTGEHSGQLSRYKQDAEEYLLNDKFEKLICIYLKTTYQSKASLKNMIENNWKPVMRKQLVEFFNRYKETITNNIFLDFVSNLNRINDNIGSFKTKEIKKWNNSNWIGFYEELEEEFEKRNLPTVVGWGYNATPQGGFWGLWWSWVALNDSDCFIYLQIEQKKLCIRLDACGKTDNVEEIRLKTIDIIKNKSNEDKYKNDLLISQSYLRGAKSGYMTVGHTSAENWIGEDQFNMDSVIERLVKYIEFIKECSK